MNLTLEYVLGENCPSVHFQLKIVFFSLFCMYCVVSIHVLLSKFILINVFKTLNSFFM